MYWTRGRDLPPANMNQVPLRAACSFFMSFSLFLKAHASTLLVVVT